MPKDEGVVVPIDLQVRDLRIEKVKTTALSKSLENVTKTYKKLLSRIEVNPIAEKLSTLFGNTKPLQEWVDAYKAGQQELLELQQKLAESKAKLRKMDEEDADSKFRAQKQYETFTKQEQEASDENYKKAIQRYAGAQSAYNRAGTDEEREERGKRLKIAKEYYEHLKYIRESMKDPNSDWNQQKEGLTNIVKAGGEHRARGEYQRQQDRVKKDQEAIAVSEKGTNEAKEQVQRFAGLREWGKRLHLIRDETDKTDKSNKKMHKTSGRTVSGMGKGFKGLLKNVVMFGFGFRSLYFLVRRLRNIVKSDFAAMSMQFDDVNQPLSELLSSFKQLKASFGTMLEPLITALAPILTQLTDKLTAITTELAKFFATFAGKNTIKVAKKEVADFASEVGNAGNKLAAYDQLNVISNEDTPEYTEETFEASEAMQSIAEVFHQVLDNLKGVLPSIMEILKAVVDALLPPLLEILPQITGLLPTIASLLGQVLGIWLEPLADLLPYIANVIEVLVKAVSKFVQKAGPMVSKVLEKILPIIEKLLNALEPIIDTVLEVIIDLLDALWPTIEILLDCIVDLIDPIIDLIDPLLQIIKDILEPIIIILNPILQLIAGLCKGLVNLLKPILELFKPLLDMLDSVLSPIVEIVKEISGPLTTDLVGGLNWLIDIITKVLAVGTKAYKWFAEKLAVLYKKIAEFLKSGISKIREFFDKIKNWGKSFVNGIITGIEWLVNKVVWGANKVISALNKLSFDVPDWVPGLGGKTFGFNIPLIPEAHIPRLAQGAVIPPNKEFLALLGDQTNGTNIEAPLEVIKQAFLEAMQESGGTNKPIVLTLDGRVIAQAVWNENDRQYKQTGKPMFA